MLIISGFVLNDGVFGLLSSAWRLFYAKAVDGQLIFNPE
jgi:hypothetical protein